MRISADNSKMLQTFSAKYTQTNNMSLVAGLLDWRVIFFQYICAIVAYLLRMYMSNCRGQGFHALGLLVLLETTASFKY